MLADLEDAEILREFERLTGYEWNLFNEGMLKASAWKIGETGERTGFLLVFHHLLTDGRGALGLAQELRSIMQGGKSLNMRRKGLSQRKTLSRIKTVCR